MQKRSRWCASVLLLVQGGSPPRASAAACLAAEAAVSKSRQHLVTVGGILAVVMSEGKPVTPDVFAVFVEGFECYNRHDFDAMMEMYAPDAVSDYSRVLFDEQPRTGRKEIRAFWDQLWDTSSGMSVRPVEVLDVGANRFIVVVAFGMRGKRSGVDVAERQAALYTMRDNQVARLDMFPDRDSALKAVGLEG
jgi:ketosteroid isomerase-like protein